MVGGGWPVVVKKDEFKVGDQVIYFEIDCWVPQTIAPFLCKEPVQEYGGVKGARLRTVKLRGQISQGLVLPLHPTLPADYKAHDDTDLTELLGVQKWEPPVQVQFIGTIPGNPFPSWIPKTDQERVQNLTSVVLACGPYHNTAFEVSVKLDGSSCTVYYNPDVTPTLGVCSRNLDLAHDDTNIFWIVAKKCNLHEALTVVGRPLALQGELIGPKINGNIDKMTDYGFYLFDIFDIAAQKYLLPAERMAVVDQLRGAGATLKHVPILEQAMCLSKFSTVGEILEYAEGPSLNHAVKREGLVFKAIDSDFSFKAVANSYLLKHAHA